MTAAAQLEMQQGRMFWFAPGTIFAVADGGEWLMLPDAWGGEALSPVTAPAGLFVPERGFGKAWRDYGLVSMLGYALGQEESYQGDFSRDGTGWRIRTKTGEWVSLRPAEPEGDEDEEDEEELEGDVWKFLTLSGSGWRVNLDWVSQIEADGDGSLVSVVEPAGVVEVAGREVRACGRVTRRLGAGDTAELCTRWDWISGVASGQVARSARAAGASPLPGGGVQGGRKRRAGVSGVRAWVLGIWPRLRDWLSR